MKLSNNQVTLQMFPLFRPTSGVDICNLKHFLLFPALTNICMDTSHNILVVQTSNIQRESMFLCAWRAGGTPLFGLYGDMLLDRIYGFWPCCLKRSVQFDLPLSLKGSEPVLNRVWYYELRDFNSNCEQSLSFSSLLEVRLKVHAIKRWMTSGRFLFLICIIST